MAYSTDNPPALISDTIGGTKQFWVYASTDAASAVRVADYITNAQALGMKAGDLVWVIDTDASPIAAQLMTVAAVDADGADLTDGTAITATNTD
ncbi:MAG TPA: hypothetical protein VFJ13_03590 [Paracoccaceae bacterium]|nr:hypothetical protein [Paracoccaceae bacterium]